MIADPEGLGDEEGRQAIRTAVALDILTLDAKGAFRAAENLTVEDATKAFSRLYVLLADG